MIPGHTYTIETVPGLGVALTINGTKYMIPFVVAGLMARDFQIHVMADLTGNKPTTVGTQITQSEEG